MKGIFHKGFDWNDVSSHVLQVLRQGFEEYWLATCSGNRGGKCVWADFFTNFLFCAWWWGFKPRKWSRNVAHSPKVMSRRSLRSSTSPKTNAGPSSPWRLTLSMYLPGYFILSICRKEKKNSFPCHQWWWAVACWGDDGNKRFTV